MRHMKKEEFRSILSEAIANEVESYTFYRGIEQCTTDNTLKKIFSDLAREERTHRETLEDFLTRPTKEFHFDESRDYKVSETLETEDLTIDMKPTDAIALAIKKEEGARDMYLALADCSTDADQKKIFTNLANMESGHKAQLEDLYTNMAFPEVW
jgi:rubrerythrin